MAEIELTHTGETMTKVHRALQKAGVPYQQAIDAVDTMQNDGIYFREGVPSEATVRDETGVE